MLKNAGHSVSQGGELSLRTAPLHGYEFNLSYGYTNAKFVSYVVNSTTDYNGNMLPYVPRNTMSAQVMKSVNINNSHVLDRIRFSLLYRGNGMIYWDEENSEKQDYYGLLDGKISFMRKSVQFDIWARNMLNTKYYSFYFEALGNKYVQMGKPAQIGMNLSIKF
jgi:outer membrane receptor protein involved in Fe transport